MLFLMEAAIRYGLTDLTGISVVVLGTEKSYKGIPKRKKILLFIVVDLAVNKNVSLEVCYSILMGFH